MFEDKMGFNQHLLSDDIDIRQGILNWLERVFSFYGKNGGVDIEVINNQILLNEKSVDYIYSDFTPLQSKYVPGSRPFLEKILAEIIDNKMNEIEKVLAIMRRCRDNRDYANKISFYGGTEEELIKRGAIQCNEISRVFVVLCQIVGFPSRLVSSHISGHMMAEVYLKKWMWIDPMHGMYNFIDDKIPASTWDLIKNPSIFEQQTKEVWKDCRPVGPIELKEFIDFNKAFAQAKAKECYFHKKEAIAIGNYFVWDFNKYTYSWQTEIADPVRYKNAVFVEQKLRKKLGWSDFYFNYFLFEGNLKKNNAEYKTYY